MNQTEAFYNQLLGNSGLYLLFFSIVPILFGIAKFHFFSTSLKQFFWYFFGMQIYNALTQLLICSIDFYYYSFWKPIFDYFKIENIHFLNIFFHFITIYFLGRMYILLTDKLIIKQIIKVAIFIILTICTVDYFFFNGYQRFGFLIPILNFFFIITVSSYYIWQISNRPTNLSITLNPFFLISICLFIRSLIELFFILVGDKLYNENFIQFVKLQLIRNGLELLSYFVFCYVFSLAKYLKFLK